MREEYQEAIKLASQIVVDAYLIEKYSEGYRPQADDPDNQQPSAESERD